MNWEMCEHCHTQNMSNLTFGIPYCTSCIAKKVESEAVQTPDKSTETPSGAEIAPNCDHPRQIYRAGTWHCARCGKQM